MGNFRFSWEYAVWQTPVKLWTNLIHGFIPISYGQNDIIVGNSSNVPQYEDFKAGFPDFARIIFSVNYLTSSHSRISRKSRTKKQVKAHESYFRQKN